MGEISLALVFFFLRFFRYNGNYDIIFQNATFFESSDRKDFKNFGDIVRLENFGGYSFDYQTQGTSEGMYHLLFMAMAGERMLQMTFSCPLEVQEDWQPLVRQMLESIQLAKEEKK